MHVKSKPPPQPITEACVTELSAPAVEIGKEESRVVEVNEAVSIKESFTEYEESEPIEVQEIEHWNEGVELPSEVTYAVPVVHTAVDTPRLSQEVEDSEAVNVEQHFNQEEVEYGIPQREIATYTTPVVNSIIEHTATPFLEKLTMPAPKKTWSYGVLKDLSRQLGVYGLRFCVLVA